jgi:hypothetical protein
VSLIRAENAIFVAAAEQNLFPVYSGDWLVYKKSLVSETHLPTASENRHFGNKQILFGGTLLEKKYVMIH